MGTLRVPVKFVYVRNPSSVWMPVVQRRCHCVEFGARTVEMPVISWKFKDIQGKFAPLNDGVSLALKELMAP
jgi:hypothetical protein